MKRGVISFAVTLVVLAGHLHAQSFPGAAASPESKSTILELGKPIEREMRGGETHSYKFHAEAGQFVHVVVLQKGIDVTVTLSDSGGKQILVVDSFNGDYGPEPVSFIPENSGELRVAVTPGSNDAAAGRYEIQLKDLRTPTDADRARMKAERTYNDGNLLLSQGSVESAKAAVAKWRESFSLWQAMDDKYGQALSLLGVAAALDATRDFEEALKTYIESLPLWRAVADSYCEASTLSNIATDLYRLGQKQKSVDYYNQAIQIQHAQGFRSDEVGSLNAVGIDYFELGETQKGLDYFNQALPIWRALGDRAGEAHTLCNIALAISSLGEKQKALDYYNQALQIQRAIGDRAGEATTLSGIGLAYTDLRENQKALDYYNQALPIERELHYRLMEATTLNNMGMVYNDLKDDQKALDSYNQAIQLELAARDLAGQARTLNNLGAIYFRLEDSQKALDYLNQALPLERSLRYRSAEAATLDNIAVSYSRLGENQKALEYFAQSLPLTRAVQNPLEESYTLAHMMEYWKKLQNPGLAVLFGKQSIDRFQQIRRNISGLEKETQQTFLKSEESYYRELAELLISQGRLPEAQQVLDLLKVEEYSKFTQRRGDAGSDAKPVALTHTEEKENAEYEAITSDITAIGSEWTQLDAKHNRSEEENRRFTELSGKLTQANQHLQAFLNTLYDSFGKGDQANARVDSIKDETSGLQTLFAGRPGTGIVGLYTVVLDQKCDVIVITQATQVAREVPIGKVALRAKVFAFVNALEERDSEDEIQAKAKELYDILIKPIEKDLRGANAKTLVWSLDDVLRYVPLAALYDGKQYLVERYQNVVITTASAWNLKGKPEVSKWRGAAMGVSKDYDGLGQLKAVPGELSSVVRSDKTPGSHGPVPGTILLDDSFTQTSMEMALEQHPPLVHIASHYVFEPGDDKKSYLLLGGKETGGMGFHLTLADLRDDQRMSFKDVELVTLSGCDTGKFSNDSDGREIDGLGITAQRKGAKSVVATLWPVEDASVGQLMANFYKLWITKPGMTKAAALQQAQLALLHGMAGSDETTSGSSHTVPPANTSLQKRPSQYANPFYWAPFILIGNWK